MRRLMLLIAVLFILVGCTSYPSSSFPDHIVLTWSQDPRTTQTIRWRTNPEITEGTVFYQKRDSIPSGSVAVPAETKRIDTPETSNDPAIHRHTAVLTDLEPATTYAYAVGTEADGPLSEWTEFTTAPDTSQPFSFVYLGDLQNGPMQWRAILRQSIRHRPDAAFYVFAGDIVNQGTARHEWDRFFEHGQNILSTRSIVPALGNHEYQDGGRELYLDLFALPDNGPPSLPTGSAYALEYSNTIIVVLDSNISQEEQIPWLIEQLANTTATWKFVLYHHPAYPSAVFRDGSRIWDIWTPIFDEYHVDMALQGHDHGYMRTFPMRDGHPVASPADGTIYITSVAGGKYYWQQKPDYAEVRYANTSTYQVIDIDANRLEYRVYDETGLLRDELVIEK